MDDFLIDAGYISLFDNLNVSFFQTGFNEHRYRESVLHAVGEGYGAFIEKAVVKRKSEFLAGRYCAHRSLATWDIAPRPIGIGDGRSPDWPHGFVGSISHCYAYAIAATARSSSLISLGLDVEEVVTAEVRRSFEKSVINDDELLLLRQFKRPERAFTLIFSIKESFFKAAYPLVKAYFGFECISVTGIDWEKEILYFRVNCDLGQAFRRGMKFSGGFKLLGQRTFTFFSISRSEEAFLNLA